MISKILKFLKFVFYIILSLPRDIRAFFAVKHIKQKANLIEKYDYSVSDVFTKWVKKHPKKVCLVFDNTKWTFQDVIIH